MTLKNVKRSLDTIAKTLEKTNKNREYIIKNSRDIIILSSQAIIAAHNFELNESNQKIKTAKIKLKELHKKASEDLRRNLIVPEQELVEATAFLSIMQEKSIPSSKTMKVSDTAYVLGLLDCIGELKRAVLDKIRIGKSKDAEKIFKIMQEMYEVLYPLAIYDKIVKESRRKLDVNRMLIEDVRTVITEEMRRSNLINILNKEQ